jgi:hypothetical protein
MSAMQWTARFDADPALLTLTVSGVAHVDGFREYLEGVLEDPAWAPGKAALIDFRDLRLEHLSFADLERIVELHVPHRTRIGNSPMAVVVSRPVDFGIVRMWESLSADTFPAHRVFYDVDDALLWLRRRQGAEDR